MTDPTAPAAPQYFVQVTQAGLALEAASHASGQPITLTHIAVGNGIAADSTSSAYYLEYDPDGSETALRGERWRGPLTQVSADPSNPSWWQAEAAIPDDVGGWYISEAGLYTQEGTLYAIAKYPPSMKPLWAAGAGRQMWLRLIFQMSAAAQVTVVVDPDVVYASREYVDASIHSQALTSTSAGQRGQLPLRDPSSASAHGVQWVDAASIGAAASVQSADFTAAIGHRYHLSATLQCTLPEATAEGQPLPAGAAIAFTKAQAASPVITAAAGHSIHAQGQSDSSVVFDINAPITLIYTGTHWEV